MPGWMQAGRQAGRRQAGRQVSCPRKEKRTDNVAGEREEKATSRCP